MKRKIALCSILLVLFLASFASAKSLPYKHLKEVSNWSLVPVRDTTAAYKNILEASKWSRLTNGRALKVMLKKKNAHGFVFQDYGETGDDPSELFSLEHGLGGGCNWRCCFSTCVKSAVGPGVAETCVGGCAGCILDGSIWGCAICASCGLLGTMTVEFCALHCCVNPGCPAGPY